MSTSKECVRRKSTLSNSERPKETAMTEAAAFTASCVWRGRLSDYHKARGCQAPLLIIKAPLGVGCLKPAFHSSRQMQSAGAHGILGRIRNTANASATN
ncbi:hypothetical protein T11_10477 [Trichinella zimbabwensis]|uniref:Uncharacterized protein n=1 Tax=Trichinella zimbabwensis TaxID=268475 RepID=A0A0V1GX90_9BILA|nr:hypothetical protein T11_10477 [Trichinella zimbabwensis]